MIELFPKMLHFSSISISKLYESATYKNIFESIKINFSYELYKNMPENTIAEKIKKLRYINHITLEQLSEKTGYFVQVLKRWEYSKAIPSQTSIKNLSDAFNISVDYFGEYYSILFGDFGTFIENWRLRNNYTNETAAKLLGITVSCFYKIKSKRLNPSYEMYQKLKELGAL